MKFINKSLSVRLSTLGLLSILAFGPCCYSRAAAQQPAAPAPPAQSAHPTLSTEISPGQVKKEENEEENVYRHTELVQSLARSFHLDVETMARVFEFINFAIIMLCIIVPLAKFLPRVIRRRSRTLSEQLEVARKTTADANARLNAVEAQLSRLDDEIAKIKTQMEEESRQDEQRIKASIEEERARIVASAEQEITVAAAQVRRGLRTFAAELAIEQAAQHLSLTPETDQALISEFVREAGNGMAKGGQK